MNPADLKIRFDELSAGRAMGDLSREEEHELAALCDQLGVSVDDSFDWLAAELEIQASQVSIEPMPEAVAARLQQWAAECSSPITEPAPEMKPVQAATIIRPEVSSWRRIVSHPALGWAAAAAVVIFAGLIPRNESQAPPAMTETRLRSEAKDLIESTFSGIGDFKQAGGTVVWSDSLQQGFMKLSGIPVNDPKKAQYQLWIVDPTRDADAPVDGGVFDIPADGSPVLVPIAAKLALSNPKAFVITLEQPGGVVKSKQEQVVALAKNG
jgi:hypothetical protein